MQLNMRKKRPCDCSRGWGDRNFLQKANILVPYGAELPGVPKLKLKETGCLIFNREDLNFGAAIQV